MGETILALMLLNNDCAHAMDIREHKHRRATYKKLCLMYEDWARDKKRVEAHVVHPLAHQIATPTAQNYLLLLKSKIIILSGQLVRPPS